MSESIKNFTIAGVALTTETEIDFQPNPKRPNSKAHARYEAYADSTTFGEYLEAADPKYALADARYDLNKGFLKLVVDHDAE